LIPRHSPPQQAARCLPLPIEDLLAPAKRSGGQSLPTKEWPPCLPVQTCRELFRGLSISGNIAESAHAAARNRRSRLVDVPTRRVGRTVWVRPGQVGWRLHYASLEVGDDLEIASAAHSLFGSMTI